MVDWQPQTARRPVLACIMALIGAVLLAGGAQLVLLGGSPYYVLAGLLVAVSAGYYHNVALVNGPPTAPSGATATASGSTVTFGWTDESRNETGFDIERARNVAGEWTDWTATRVDADTTSVTYPEVADGDYAYLVRAVNAAGASNWAIAQVTVSGATAPPAAPTDLSAVPTGSNVAIGWTDTSDDEFGFQVMRARLAGSEWTDWTAHALDRDAVTFDDVGVADGTYAYLVRSYNPVGASAWTVVVVTVSTATGPPSAVDELLATVTGRTVNLVWTDTADNETGIDIERARNVAGEWTEWTAFAADRDTTAFTDTVVRDGTYAYLVRAHNALGASPWTIGTVVVSQATDGPDAPTGLTATRVGSDIVLHWTDESAGDHAELWFDIERARYVNGTWTDWTGFPADRNATSATDTVPADGQYAYLIRAHNAVGSSAWTVVVTTVPTTTQPPAAPTGLSATRSGADVTLAWTDNSSAPGAELWFDIERATYIGGTWTNWTLFTAAANSTGFVSESVSYLDVGIKLKGTAPAGRLEAAGSWNQMVTHRVRIESAKEINAELVAWLKEAYSSAG